MTAIARFARQLSLPGFGRAAQEALGASRVLVIGAGGLGSTVIPALAAAGVGTIGIVDADTVELSNLHRQHVHGVGDVGRLKVDSAAESIAAIAPETVVEPIAERLTSANALDLVSRYDLLVDGSDNFPTRYLANDAAALAGVPLVWGAVLQYGGQAGACRPAQGPGYRDLFPTPPPAGSVLDCATGGVLPTVCGVVGSIMATEAIKLLTGVGEPLLGRVTTYDALTGGFRELDYGRDPEAAPITGLIDYELFCGVAPTAPATSAEPTGVSAPELAALLNGEAELDPERATQLVDVREPWEFELARLPGALLLPLGQLPQAMDALDRDRPVVVYCHHGIRSQRALETLRAAGFAVRHLTGGIDAWSLLVDDAVARY